MRLFSFMLLTIFALTACASPPSTPPPPTSTPTPPPAEASATANPQAPCLEAAKTALQMEISTYQKWLANTTDEAKKATYTQALNYLQDRLHAYEAMSPQDYRPDGLWQTIPGADNGHPLPPQKPIVLGNAWLDSGDPPQVHFPKQTRSGPFYIVVGAAEGIRLHPGVHYHLTLLPIMPQTYPFPSYYVCVLKAVPLPTPQ